MLNQNIRKIRLVSNYKQSYVADRLGISQPEYSKIENGKRVPNADNIRQLCELYDVPVSVFFSPEEAEKILGVQAFRPLSPSENQIRESIRLFLENHATVQFNEDKRQEMAQMVFRSFLEFISSTNSGQLAGIAS